MNFRAVVKPGTGKWGIRNGNEEMNNFPELSWFRTTLLTILRLTLVVESFGLWTAHSIKLLKSIAGRVALSANISKSLAYSNLIQQLSIKLWSFNAKMILFRLHSLSPTLNFASSFFDFVYTNHLLEYSLVILTNEIDYSLDSK